MRVVCTLRQIQEELGWTRLELASKLEVDPRALKNFLSDEGGKKWRLDRDVLHRLVFFAHAHGRQLFQVEPHPMWETFVKKHDIAIFRGGKKEDADVERCLHRYLDERFDSSASAVAGSPSDLMKQRNCIIIGSPKHNRASEIALALLWGAEPNDGSPKNQERIPFHFAGMELSSGLDSALVTRDSSLGYGINVLDPKTEERRLLKVDWLPPDEYKSSMKSGQDVAVLVACYRPLGTSEPVTTIVISGYTYLSTLEATRALECGNIPELNPSATPGKPCIAVMKFEFTKKLHAKKGVVRVLKEKTSPLWAVSPWDTLFFSNGVSVSDPPVSASENCGLARY